MNELIPLAIAVLVGICLGAAGYRYLLKRNPAKLEAWAAAAKAAGQKIEG